VAARSGLKIGRSGTDRTRTAAIFGLASVAVGAWGTAVFSNDTSSDVRSEFGDLIADGLDAKAATDRLVASYKPGTGEDPSDFWLGLAVVQHRLGRLLPEVHEQAVLAAQQEDMRRWEPEDRLKRARAVAKALAELAQPQPEVKPVKKDPKSHTDLVPGQHFLYEFAKGRKALFRVQGLQDGDSPRLTLLRWQDSEPVPTGHALLSLGPPDTDDEQRSPVGVWVYGTRDPASRITMLPETMPPPERSKRHWWSRRREPSPYDDIFRPLVAWRSLPKWFTEDGRLLDPRSG
jgi:hypothetical protein